MKYKLKEANFAKIIFLLRKKHAWVIKDYVYNNFIEYKENNIFSPNSGIDYTEFVTLLREEDFLQIIKLLKQRRIDAFIIKE